MDYQQAVELLREMRRTIGAADSIADGVAELLIGRLRRVNTSTLKRLKKELRDFDMTTHRWKP